MIIDASSKYTNSDINNKKENLTVIEQFIHKSKNVSEYSHTKIVVNTGTQISADYTYSNKQLKAAPEKLKRAMFKTSSRGIAAALNK